MLTLEYKYRISFYFASKHEKAVSVWLDQMHLEEVVHLHSVIYSKFIQ